MTFLAGLFGGSKKQSSQQTAAAGIQGQTSVAGKPISLVYGTTRIAPNYIWYGDFTAVQNQAQAGGGGGKGGVTGGGGGKGGGGSVQYTYFTSFISALCDGQITGINQVWVDKNITTLAALGMNFFNGSSGQSPWSYMTTNHPDQALGYNNIAYIAAASYSLGNSPQLPNHNYEVLGIYYNTAGNGYDADPSLVVTDILSNPVHGAGLASSYIGNLTTYQSYCLAAGLWISPAYDSQQQMSSIIDDIAQATNSAVVWSSGVMNIIPYGDQNITANGHTYTAPSAPLYSLTDDDYMPNTGGHSTLQTDNPVQIVRKRVSDSYNVIKVEYLDRTNQYQPAIAQASDFAEITEFGVRQDGVRAFHLFCDPNAAQTSAQLQLQRQSISNIYSFTLDQRYIVLDPMDIIAVTDSTMELTAQWVRVIEVTENDDMSISILAEEYLAGTGNAPLYTYQSGLAYFANYNIDPGNANAPVIFEPVAQYSESLEVIMGICGGVYWGGCDVWISTDGVNYKNAGRITGQNRMGVLTSSLSSVSSATTGQTIDTSSTLSVNLTESLAALTSASLADATNLATLCYVDGELISYETATLTSAYNYNLTYLIRGCYDSPISTHNMNSQFLRLDQNVFKYFFAPAQIGQTIAIKLVSFNIWGGGQQDISAVLPIYYTLQGTAYTSPLPDIENLITTYVANLTQLTWDEVTDFRPVLYEIRKGTQWDGATFLARQAHPPFNVQGDGTYWVAAYTQPVAGLQAYSPNPSQVIITGSVITENIIASWDEGATGWTGTLGGTAEVTPSGVVTSGMGNILTATDYLNIPDILNYGGEGNGSYTIPSSHFINIGRVAPCNVIISWTSQGQKITDNILSVADYLGDTDVLDYASTVNTNVYPQIALSQDGVTYGAWQNYVMGAYNAMAFKAQMQITTSDPQTQAILSSFVFEVDVPARIDHYVNQSISSSGTTITFRPDGSSSTAAFNGGTAGNRSLPSLQVTILNAVSGDTVNVSSLTLSSCTIQVLNTLVGVARNCNILAEGY